MPIVKIKPGGKLNVGLVTIWNDMENVIVIEYSESGTMGTVHIKEVKSNA